MLSKRKYLCVCLVASLFFFVKPALAEDSASDDAPWEKFNVNLGYFISTVNTELSFGTGLGVSVDVEDTLGLDSTNSGFRVDGFWRFTDNRRHGLGLSWFSLRRDATRTVGRSFPIKDKDGNEITIPAGSRVESFLDIDIYKASYSYSFFQDDRMDLAANIGLYVMPIDIGLKATGLIDVDEKGSFTAPLPTFGIRADFAITPKWFLRSGFEVFYLEIQEFTGYIYGSHVAVEYLPWKHLGFGLGYNVLNVGIEADGEDYPGIDFKGELDFKYTGLLLYAKMPF